MPIEASDTDGLPKSLQSDSASRELLEFAPDAIIGITGDGRIRLANSQVETLFGWPREELIGMSLDTLVPERFRTAHAGHRMRYFDAPRTRPMGAGLELYALRKDGSEFPCEISLSMTGDESGTVAVAAVRDVTERRQFERELQGANAELERANLAKDSFLASMSHELRTPLNAILGFTGTLLMELPGKLNDEQRQQLQTVQSNGRHLLSIINDLLDVAKIESGKFEIALEPVDCSQVIEDVISGLRPIADEKELEFRVTVPDERLIIDSDRRALSQILINLVNNAIKYTDEGCVCLDVSRHSEDGFEITSFAVADTGRGIEPEDQEKLFDAFEQIEASTARQYEGTGLGLYISRRLADLIGGQVRVESEPGRGSTFTLELVDQR
jgi:protein-histidine pros-kinase